ELVAAAVEALLLGGLIRNLRGRVREDLIRCAGSTNTRSTIHHSHGADAASASATDAVFAASTIVTFASDAHDTHAGRAERSRDDAVQRPHGRDGCGRGHARSETDGASGVDAV